MIPPVFLSSSLFLIRAHWKLATIAGLLALLAYQNVSSERYLLFVDTIPYYKEKLIERDQELRLALQSNENLTAAIENRNEQIERQAELTDKLESQFDDVAEELANIRQSTDRQVRTILSQRAPETCEAAFEYLRDSIPELMFRNRLDTFNEGDQ